MDDGRAGAMDRVSVLGAAVQLSGTARLPCGHRSIGKSQLERLKLDRADLPAESAAAAADAIPK